MDEKKPRSWNQKDLERASGVPYGTLTGMLKPEGSRSLPRPENVDKVADALGIPRGELRRAAQIAAGYAVEEVDVPEDPELRVFISTYSRMSDEDRERLMEVVRGIATNPAIFPSLRDDQ